MMKFSGCFDGEHFRIVEGAGEHYNHLQITGYAHLHFRDELTDKLGIRQNDIHNYSDLRLILKAYLKWSYTCFNHLEGEWAVVLFDEQRRECFLSRDPSENSSLFFVQQKSNIYFSSNTYYFLSIPELSLEIDRIEFVKLSLRLIGNSSGKTVIHNLFYVKPGYSYCFNHRFEKFEFHFGSNPVPKLKYKSEKDYFLQFRSHLSNAILERVSASKKVGIFLSSGLDSTTVCSFLSRAFTDERNISAYTSVPSYLDSAKLVERLSEEKDVIAFLNMYPNVQGNFMKIPHADFESSIMDETSCNLFYPVVHSNGFWIHGIMQKAKADGVDLMMTGQMGNYSISFKGDYPSLEISFQRACQYICYVCFGRMLYRKREQLFSVVRNKILRRFWRKHMKSEMILGYSYRYAVSSFRKEMFHKIHCFASTYWSLIAQQYGIRIADPTSDVRLNAFLQSIPTNLFYRKSNSKYLIKRSMKGLLPDCILNNAFPKPQTADLGARLEKENFLQSLVENIMEQFKDDDYFDTEKIRRIYDEIRQTKNKAKQHVLGFHFLYMVSLMHFYGRFNKPKGRRN